MTLEAISRKKLYIWIGAVVAIVLLGFGLAKIDNKKIDILNSTSISDKKLNPSTVAGIECENYNARPFAVMLSSDKEARPLSGVGEADMVFEMPVVANGFTRMMAVYQCNRPKKLGSVRSSRLDFVPLALGFNAIYAHFGGEKEVLDELNAGIIDNIDGLKYDGTIYYREKSIPMPHNAFTNFNLLGEISSKLGYKLSSSEVSYMHEEDGSKGEIEPGPIFNKEFRVVWEYKKETNSYFRSRASKPEIDKNTGKQVEAKNIVIMKTTWSPINKDYIRVKTVGSGGLLVYKNGAVITGTWEKKNDRAKLFFYDQNHKEIPFVAGSVWVEIVTN
ncbi:MAG: DUF3048 domain-containing protein [Candidatus Yanofskybacteria bacterium]|nr:DUF3048 domain-containing protein [Candidatus Yanofskybacteria bacterium]